MKIGVLELFSWNEVKNGKRKKHFGIDRCCEDCIMGWDIHSYEGECEDCGCCFNYEFDVPIWKCALPDWIKNIIKKMRGVGLMTKRKLIDMFKNKIFPKQAEDLLKMNYEGLGELDKREFLRDTSILIMLAEKGLKTEQEIVKPYLEKLKAEISEMDLNKVAKNYEDRFYVFQNEILQMIDNLLSESEGKE